MPVIVETQTDAFAHNLSDKSFSPPADSVRRPFRGIEIKNDTYATIQVIGSDGYTRPLVDAGGSLPPSSDNAVAGSKVRTKVSRNAMNSSYFYSNFIIQSVKDSRQEKAQFMETFGDTYIFFFGERPRILTVQGLLFNTLDFNWRTEFWYNYENYLRGTKLVEQNARIYLHWDDIVVEGYMLGADAADDADMPYHIPFTFQLFVTNHTYLSQYLGLPEYPIRATNGMTDYDPARSALTVANASDMGKLNVFGVQQLNAAVQIGAQSALAAGLVGTGAAASALLGDNSKGPLAKSLMLDLLSAGVMAQSITFLNVIRRYFKATPAPRPLRSLGVRTNIADNEDEYVGGMYKNISLDSAAAQAADARMRMLQTAYDIESSVIYTLNQLQVNAVQLNDPEDGVSPLSQASRLMVGTTPLGSIPANVVRSFPLVNRLGL